MLTINDSFLYIYSYDFLSMIGNVAVRTKVYYIISTDWKKNRETSLYHIIIKIIAADFGLNDCMQLIHSPKLKYERFEKDYFRTYS